MNFIFGLDFVVEQWFALHRTPFFDFVFLWITWLGDARVITVVALSVALVLWRHRKLNYKAGFAFALFGSLFFSYGMKNLFDRARPHDFVPLINVTGYSFPSMHAAVSTAVYGFLAYMIWKLVHPPSHRLPAVVVLVVLIILIGISRLYLGVHYFSDVIGGFIVGAFFVWLGAKITRNLSRGARGRST